MRTALLIAVAAAVLAATAQAAVPPKISYQVMLTDSSLEPRRELVSVPYAYRASHADTQGGGSDGDWTISGNDIYPTVSGNVGTGTAVPGAPLHVAGNNWDLDATEGDLKIGSATHRLKIGVATEGGGAGTCGIRAMGGSERLILGAGSAEVLEVGSSATVKLGSETDEATFELYREGTAVPIARLFDYYNCGASLALSDTVGTDVFRMEPDFNGGGGWFQMARNTAGSNALRIDGNFNGTESPIISMYGTSTYASFDMSNTGDFSVNLPQACISSYETNSEPGVSSSTITAPADGYALVVGSAQTMVYHENGTNSSVDAGAASHAGRYRRGAGGEPGRERGEDRSRD